MRHVFKQLRSTDPNDDTDDVNNEGERNKKVGRRDSLQNARVNIYKGGRDLPIVALHRVNP
jgi:hypothetical protein